MNRKPLYCVICSVIFIVALKKCAVVLMLISHFIVDEDWKLSCCKRLTWQAFWQRGEKSHLCQWKQSKMEANLTIKVAKDREEDIPPFWRQMRGEGWHGGWRGSDEGPRGEERLMKWLQDRENTRRRWMLKTWVCGRSMLCNHHSPHFLLFTTYTVSITKHTRSCKQYRNTLEARIRTWLPIVQCLLQKKQNAHARTSKPQS